MKNGHDFTAKSNPGHSPNAGHRTNANFARAITLAEFGWRNGKMLDQTDFRDRPPARIPAPTPEARSR